MAHANRQTFRADHFVFLDYSTQELSPSDDSSRSMLTLTLPGNGHDQRPRHLSSRKLAITRAVLRIVVSFYSWFSLSMTVVSRRADSLHFFSAWAPTNLRPGDQSRVLQLRGEAVAFYPFQSFGRCFGGWETLSRSFNFQRS